VNSIFDFGFLIFDCPEKQQQKKNQKKKKKKKNQQKQKKKKKGKGKTTRGAGRGRSFVPIQATLCLAATRRGAHVSGGK
jgi:hypothetical protein